MQVANEHFKMQTVNRHDGYVNVRKLTKPSRGELARFGNK